MEKKINYGWPFVGRSTNCSNPELGRMSSLHTNQATHQAGAYPAVSVTWSDWSLPLNLPVLISTPGKETQTVSYSRAQLNHRANRRLNQDSESGKNYTVLSWCKCIILKDILKEVNGTSVSSLFLLAAKKKTIIVRFARTVSEDGGGRGGAVKMSPVRTRTQISQSGGERTNHKPSSAPSLEDLHCKYKKCLAKSFLLLYMNDFDLHFKFHQVFSWNKNLVLSGAHCLIPMAWSVRS